MKKNIAIIIIFLISIFLIGIIAYLGLYNQEEKFDELSSDEMLRRIIQERDFAIGKAVMAGDYKCCINPPCTMCYMEGNQWNNEKAGTCACDDLLTQGEEACPQCKSGLCNNGNGCDFK